MWQNKRHFGFVLVAAFGLCPSGASAQDAGSGRDRTQAGTEPREELVRIQVNVNLFFAGPSGESEEAVKLRERVRRSIYEMAADECPLVEKVLAKTCRLESVNVGLNRQSGQTEGYMASGNFVMRVTLK